MKIYFVCTGNTCRSPMAEYLLRHKLESNGILNHEISSFGIFALDNMNISQETKDILLNRGIESDHRAKGIKQEYIHDADLILTMSNTHKRSIENMFPCAANNVYTLREYLGETGNVEDPFGLGLQQYERLETQLDDLLDKLLDKLRNMQ